MEPNALANKACEAAGGQAELARKLGVSPSAIQQWRTGLRPIPIQYCSAIEKATGGLVTRKDLRPDDWKTIWPELAGITPHNRRHDDPKGAKE